jgi:hypothetical protein
MRMTSAHFVFFCAPPNPNHKKMKPLVFRRGVVTHWFADER